VILLASMQYLFLPTTVTWRVNVDTWSLESSLKIAFRDYAI